MIPNRNKYQGSNHNFKEPELADIMVATEILSTGRYDEGCAAGSGYW